MIGYGLAVAIALVAFASATLKLVNSAKMRAKWCDQLQMPDGLRVPAGCAEFIAAVLFLIPTTAITGAVLLTAYLGGAVALHLRVSVVGPAIYAASVIAMVWVSIHLR